MVSQRTLENVRKLRKRHNLTQKELAGRAGVSQSLIAKIESGRIDPSFTKAELIFSSLDELQESQELKAKEVMQRKVYFANHKDTLKKIIQTFRDKGISQMPVLSGSKVLGLITESAILKKISGNPRGMDHLTAIEAMEEIPPLISPKTGMKMLLNLLQENPLVLVYDEGEIKGVICKTDLLKIN